MHALISFKKAEAGIPSYLLRRWRWAISNPLISFKKVEVGIPPPLFLEGGGGHPLISFKKVEVGHLF